MRLVNMSGMLAVLVSLFPVVSAAGDPADLETRVNAGAFFDQTFYDLPDEIKQARAEGKLGVLVMFEAEDCPWCAKMKETVLNRVGVQQWYRKRFRILSMDIAGDVPVRNFSGKEMSQKIFSERMHRVRATPVFIFFDLDGHPVVRYTGATENAAEFMLLGEFVESAAWRETDFAAWKRRR